MISAYEARRRAEEVGNNKNTVKKKTRQELKMIEKKIKEAVKKGSYSIVLDGRVSCQTEDYLQQLGYGTVYSFNKGTTTVTWF